MEPALDVTNRALRGDPGARAFLERTSSIYVLDVTDTAKPKTYGCWNFIHQAMNEVERYEASFPRGGGPIGDGLTGIVRLLTSMALRVARRSPATDRALIDTCLSNASDYSASPTQFQWLVDLNFELREIVMGRIAAMAFDFSFHRPAEPHGRSSFADSVVMDTFCAVLSANAVASGPLAIKHFVTEWIIPSSRNLPAFAVASVVLHLALESGRKSSREGTKDMLQQLSSGIMFGVLAPVLADAVSENSGHETDTSRQHEESSRVATMCLRAVRVWCEATNLSLPQIRHICNKAGVDVVAVLSDAMYSGSEQVIDALAELIETTVLVQDDTVISLDRMNQVRHIMQVDEETFRARFSPDQLKTIESKEMESIVDELVSAIGMQRFRFSDRQAKGDHHVCRNLARIGASVTSTWLDAASEDHSSRAVLGAVGLLMKAAAHPLVNISAIALHLLTRLMTANPALSVELLPVLQRRAITPHRISDGKISLESSDLLGATFDDFRHFREHVLSDALVVCWRTNGAQYMDSCVSAVEEFCSNQASADVSLPLEAALFCIEQVASEALGSHDPFPHTALLKRLFSALYSKPRGLMANPLTRGRQCRLIRMYSRWCADEGGLGVATDLALSSFLNSTSVFAEDILVAREQSSAALSASDEAAFALKELLLRAPKHYANSASISSLGAAWEAAVHASERPNKISIEARLALCTGICSTVAVLDDPENYQSLDAMMSQSLERMERLSRAAQDAYGSSSQPSILSLLGDEIQIVARMSRSFADGGSTEDGRMESGCDTSPDMHSPVPEAVLQIVRRSWPNIMHTASHFSGEDAVSSALSSFMSELLPPKIDNIGHLALLKDLCSISSSIIKAPGDSLVRFEAIFDFAEQYVKTYGEGIESGALAALSGSTLTDQVREVGRLLEELLLNTVAAVQESLGDVWTSPREQGQGQAAFESKPPAPAPKAPPKSNELLGGLLSLLAKCLNICPLFLLHVPAAPGVNRDSDLLLRRAVDSAVSCLDDVDPETTRCAIHFLHEMAHRAFTQDPNFQSLTGSLSRIRGVTTTRIIAGSCNKFQFTAIADAAELLSVLLKSAPRPDVEALIISALQNEHFLLGDPSKNLTVAILKRVAADWTAKYLTSYLEEIWELHQVEDTDALPSSDVVAAFLRKYGAAVASA